MQRHRRFGGRPLIGRAAFVLAAAFAASLAAAGSPATNVATGVDQFEIHPAFQLERVAGEPIVQDPVDLQFDERGRAFVIEMGGYPFASEVEAEYPGRLVLLEDADEDGIYDRRTVFADRFQYANSILPYRDGWLVASPPHLLFVKDSDGDNRADIREVLVSGFTVGNAQHNFNGLIHGLDNWIYAGNGGNSGAIFWPDRPDEKFPLLHRDMKFDLGGKRFEFFGRTTTGFAVALDDWGHVFTTHNLKHVNHLVFPNRYLDPHPQLSPRTNPDISDHKTGSLDRAYPIGKQEARLNHPEQSGYFSCSCGITFYGGGAFPEEFNGNLLVADSVMNLVHRDVLRPDGPGFLAGRGREKVDFLATADRHSRPVNLRVGPDGALYVVDMYRAVIEHPEWIPDELEKDMDLYAGTNQGRIYRIAPQGGLPRVKPEFPRDDLATVVGHLAHPNKWWRDTAQRLLVDWNDPRSAPLLRNLARTSANPKARVHALWTLHGLKPAVATAGVAGCLTEDLLLSALHDPHEGVRENALILAEQGLNASPARIDAALALTRDPVARVRMQAVLSLGTLPWADPPGLGDRVLGAMLDVLDQDGTFEWSRFAVLTCAARAPTPLIDAILARPALPAGSGVAGTSARTALLNELGELVGARRRWPEVAAILQSTDQAAGRSEPDALALLSGFNAGLRRDRSGGFPEAQRARIELSLRRLQGTDSIRLLTQVWETRSHLGLPVGAEQAHLLEAARRVVEDRSASVDDRLARLGLLRFSPFGARRDLLFARLDFREPRELQRAALDQLVQQLDPVVADTLIAKWKTLSREARSQASDYLVYRAANHDLLLTALETGRLQMGQLNLDLERRRRLLWSDDETVRRRAEALFTDAGIVTRGEVLRQMQPATRLAGDPERGRKHYDNLCATCHTMGSTGFAVGPDLTEISRKGAATLLSDILDPNAAVNLEYLNYTIEDTDDEVYSGIITSETEATVSLRAAGGVDYTIARERIAELTSSGLSLMPEGLEAGLSLQDVADLLAYLQQPK
ncbi:MAG: c-type cytochrome [Verrucomicrobiales bacterium]|nr:c-type cytochrome [Verrucomicrobiales bacterium]MCP5525749.1 c-type cytochrome [Verrucomicrobiales bacterium]